MVNNQQHWHEIVKVLIVWWSDAVSSLNLFKLKIIETMVT